MIDSDLFPDDALFEYLSSNKRHNYVTVKTVDYATVLSKTKELAKLTTDIPALLDTVEAEELKGADEIGKAVTKAFVRILKHTLEYSEFVRSVRPDLVSEVAHFAHFLCYTDSRRSEGWEPYENLCPGRKVINVYTTVPQIDWEFYRSKFPFNGLAPLLQHMLQELSIVEILEQPSEAKQARLALEFFEIVR